ncbi:cupin domain-containing protein [Halobacterium yunchengense]|uniref:cupin domain-containing protein n=1 Tax=Halobacterium yunchengense TaxID=3108497 RepID=UPI0030080E6C
MAPDSDRSPAVEVTAVDALDETPHAEVFDVRDPRTVRLSLAAGDSVPRHQHPDSMVVLYVLDGELELTLGDDQYDLAAGDAVRFDGAQDVSPHAVADARALVVFAPKP